MRKQMEGDSKQRRKAARDARRSGAGAADYGMTTGASKQRTHEPRKAEHDERLAMTQRGEAKQAGREVPRPLRGKGRRNLARVPPGPAK